MPEDPTPRLYALALRITGDERAAADTLREVLAERGGSGNSYPELVRRIRDTALARENRNASPPVLTIRDTTPSARRLVEAAFFGGTSVRELSAATRLPETEVRQLLCRGMAELRQQLGGQER